MPAKCIGGPPAALPYQYLMMGKPQSLTLTGEEAVLRMPSPDSKGSAARATIQRQQELDALMAGGPPLWSPQHPNFGDPLAVSTTVGGVACGGEGEEEEAAIPSASPSVAASQRTTAAAATAHASSSASLTPTMEHYHTNGMHSHANYAQRLFDEILEARHRRLQEYEAAQWDQTDPQHVQKARQIVAQLQQDDNDDSDSESDKDGNEGRVTQRENAAAPAASSSSSPLLDPSSHMKQRREKERTDEEEITRLQRRAANKKAKASRAAYHAALVADLSPFVSQLLWKGLEQEMTLRAQQQWEAEDLKLRQMNEEEGLRREAARLAEDTMHAAVVAERERRYFDTVDPVMSQLRKDAEARRQAAAAREAEKEAQELEELEQRLQALTNPINNNNSAAPRANHNGSSSGSAKQQPNSALNEQLRAQQRRLKQQMDDAARYEESKQKDEEEIEQQQQARLSRPSSTTQSSAISNEPPTSSAQPFHQSARPASSKVAADDVRALLNVIELAVDSAEDASLGRGLSLLLQGMDV